MQTAVLALTLSAAALHAIWNALLRSGEDRLWSVTAMSFATTAIPLHEATVLTEQLARRYDPPKGSPLWDTLERHLDRLLDPLRVCDVCPEPLSRLLAVWSCNQPKTNEDDHAAHHIDWQ
jgi:hypothetical protein